jgi:hypothetical protein
MGGMVRRRRAMKNQALDRRPLLFLLLLRLKSED